MDYYPDFLREYFNPIVIGHVCLTKHITYPKGNLCSLFYLAMSRDQVSFADNLLLKHFNYMSGGMIRKQR